MNVLAAVVLAAVIAWSITHKTPQPEVQRPQIWCDDARQRWDGYGGWPLCELKLREA